MILLLNPIKSICKYQDIPIVWIASIQALESTTDDSARVPPIVPVDGLDLGVEIRPQVLGQFLSRVDRSAGNEELRPRRQLAHRSNHF